MLVCFVGDFEKWKSISRNRSRFRKLGVDWAWIGRGFRKLEINFEKWKWGRLEPLSDLLVKRGIVPCKGLS